MEYKKRENLFQIFINIEKVLKKSQISKKIEAIFQKPRAV